MKNSKLLLWKDVIPHHCNISLNAKYKLHKPYNQRRQWQPTPVFLPRESQRHGSLVGFRLWGRAELDTTEATQQQQAL